MQLSEVKEVVQVSGAAGATAKIREGWTLLGFVPGTTSGMSGSSVLYVLGKPAEPEKGNFKDGEWMPDEAANRL